MSDNAWFRQSTTDQFNRNASLRETCVLSVEHEESRENERRRYDRDGFESDAVEGSPVGRNGCGAVPLCAWPERRVVDLRGHNRPCFERQCLVCEAAGHAVEADTDHAGDTPSVSAKHA